MRRHLKRDSIKIIVLLLLVGMTWWWLSNNGSVVEEQDLSAQFQVDGYLSHFVATTMNEQGHPNHRLEAEKMVLFTGTKLSQVDKPLMTLYRENDNPWLIRAETGLVQTDTDIVFLTGNVRMTHEDYQGNLTEVLTEKLEVWAKNHYAETQNEVILNHYQGSAVGIGMQAYLNESRLSLLDQVRSRYETSNH